MWNINRIIGLQKPAHFTPVLTQRELCPMGGWAPEPMRLGMDGSSTTNRKKMPRGYCGFVGENLGTKHLESFAASLKMLHLFDNLGLVDIILYICILCVYIYVCVGVCVCICVHVWAMQKLGNLLYHTQVFLGRSGPWPLLAVSFGTSFLLFRSISIMQW